MRYIIGFICLMVILSYFSCKGQKNDLKGDSENQTNTSEAKETKHPKFDPMGEKRYIPGEIVIKFKDGTDLHSIRAIQKRLDLTTIKVVPKLNIYRMKIMNGSPVEEVMKRLQGFSEVEYSEPNYTVDFQ